MKIEYTEKQKLAIKECKILWKYLAETGGCDKEEAVIFLYSEGKLSTAEYRHNCPLCDCFECGECPWTAVSIRYCIHKSSPYYKWLKYRDDKELAKEAADEVCALLERIKINEG